MYLYAHLPNGDKLFCRRVAEMSWEKTRALLTEHFPGARILSPLEASLPADRNTFFTVITIYGSTTPDGRARCTGIDQWGVRQNREAAPAQSAPADLPARLSLTDIQYMTEHIRRWTFKHLIETTTISRPAAMRMATDAGEHYAAALEEFNRNPLREVPE